MNSVEYLPLSAVTAAPKTKFCEVFAVVIPTAFTAAGSLPCAVLTRFWMSTVARSGSRFRSKVAVMLLDPSLPLVELMYFIPICSVDLLLQGNGHRTLHRLSAGAGVEAGDANLRRRQIRKLRDRQRGNYSRTCKNNQQR